MLATFRENLDCSPAPKCTVGLPTGQRHENNHEASLMTFLKSPIIRAAAFVFTGVLIGATILVFSQRSFYYGTSSKSPGMAIYHLERAFDVQLTTSDGLSLGAWHVEPTDPNDWAVLYLPGNGGTRFNRDSVGQALADEGFAVLLLDYRGFAGNPGNPTEAGLNRDAKAGVQHLNDSGYPNERIIYVGESIGAGVATQLAAQNPPAAMLLRSPFTRLADAAEYQTRLPIGLFIWDTFDSLGKAPTIESPVLVLAGSEDTIVPASQSRELSAAFPNLVDYLEVPSIGHNDEIWFGRFLAEKASSLLPENDN